MPGPDIECASFIARRRVGRAASMLLRTRSLCAPAEAGARGVLDRRGMFQFVDIDGSTKTEALLPQHRVVQRRDKPSSQDVIVPLAQELVAKGEKVLVFRNMRSPAQGCAKYLSKELGLGGATAVIDALPTQDLTGAESARALHRARQGDVWVDQGAARAIARRAPGWSCPAKGESHPLWRIEEMSYPDVGSCRR